MKVTRKGSFRYQPGRFELSPDGRQAILHVVRAGWAFASKIVEEEGGNCEDVLNELLRDGMRFAVEKDRALGQHRRLPEMRVLPEGASRSCPEVDRPDGRPDIPILLSRPFSQEAHAVIECKRVAGNRARLCRLYVVEGIDRFKNDKYAGNHATAFMVGYVITGTCVAAVDGVNGYLQRKERPQDQLEEWLPGADRSTWRSRHSRTSGFPIVLFHTFVAARAS